MRTSAIDWAIAVLAIAGLALFLSIIALWVPEPVLVIVLGIGLALATYDLIVLPLRKRRANGRRE